MSSSQRQIRVLVCRSDQNEEDSLCQTLRAISPSTDPPYALNVLSARQLSPTEPVDYFSHLNTLVRQHRCHVVLLEDSIMTCNQRSLRRLVQSLKPAEPFLLTDSIIQTEIATYAALERVIPVWGKGDDGTEWVNSFHKYMQLLHHERYDGGLEIFNLEDCLRGVLFSIEETHELLERLFPNEKAIEVERVHWGEYVSTEAGYKNPVKPGSLLLKIDRKDRVPVVVKIARRERVEQEAGRFSTYIQERLMGLRHTHVIRHQILWNIGGLVLTFIGAKVFPVGHDSSELNDKDTRLPDTLAQHMLAKIGDANQNKVLEKVVDDLFHVVLMLLRQTRDPLEDTPPPLFDQYNLVWSSPGEEWQDEIASLQNCDDQPKFVHFSGIPFPLYNPIRWVWDNRNQSRMLKADYPFRGHGDLHADNILVEGHYSWLLDFERSGPGPRLQDFVELELDLLTRLTLYSGDLRLICRVAIAVVRFETVKRTLSESWDQDFTDLPSVLRTLSLVEQIRILAANISKYDDPKEYLWGLLLNTVFKLKQAAKHGKSKWTDAAAILGAIICIRLEQASSDFRVRRQAEAKLRDLQSALELNQNEGEQKVNPPVVSGRFEHGYAVIIGVGNCSVHGQWSLPTTANDATRVREMLVDSDRASYPEDHVHCLTHDSASLEQIRWELKYWLPSMVKNDRDATVVVYFSGHGWQATDGRYALVPSDVQASDLPKSVLWNDEFADLIRSIPCKKLLVVLDCCFAAGIGGIKDISAFLPKNFSLSPPTHNLFESLKAGEGRIIIASSKANQYSWIRNNHGISIFTDHFLEAMAGKGLPPDTTEVRISHIIDYLGETVPRTARRECNAEQIPWIEWSGEARWAVALNKNTSMNVSSSELPGTNLMDPMSQYNREGIRLLLEAALTPEQLVDLLADHYPEVYRNHQGQNDHTLRRKLLDYCAKRNNGVEDLLMRVRSINLEVFELYSNRVDSDSTG